MPTINYKTLMLLFSTGGTFRNESGYFPKCTPMVNRVIEYANLKWTTTLYVIKLLLINYLNNLYPISFYRIEHKGASNWVNKLIIIKTMACFLKTSVFQLLRTASLFSSNFSKQIYVLHLTSLSVQSKSDIANKFSLHYCNRRILGPP